MKLNQSKRWFINHISNEQNLEVTAGIPNHCGANPLLLAKQQELVLTISSYILQLLHARQCPVARSYLEPALIFMFLDHVRQGVLKKKPRRINNDTAEAAAKERTASVLSWLDSHLAMMQQADQVRVTVERNKQLISISPSLSDLAQAPPELVTKVNEAIKAMGFLKNDRAAQDFLHEVVDANDLPVFA